MLPTLKMVGGFRRDLDMKIRNGFYAEFNGNEYECDYSPNKREVRLWSDEFVALSLGFAFNSKGDLEITLPKSDLAAVYYVTTYCMYRGQSCLVSQINEDLRVHLYLKSPSPAIAADLEFDSPERGVFEKWVLTTEVSDVHEDRKQKWPSVS